MINQASLRYIGLNQRIPIRILDHALERFLYTGELDRTELHQDILQETKGRNRASKATSYAWRILTKSNKILHYIKKQIGPDVFLKLSENDRKTIIFCLTAIAFPILYNFVVTLGRILKIQKEVGKVYINRKMAALYGGNRTLDIAIDAIIPMLIELNILTRVKLGLYSKDLTVKITNSRITELLIYTDITLSGSKSITIADTKHRPLYFFKQIEFNKNICTSLIQGVEGQLGGGYIFLA